MITKTSSFLKVLSAIVLLLVSIHCSTSSAADSSTKTLFIASETKDCTGVAPMKCLQVREKNK
ncbi:hypothetical protein [Chryseobacterium sp.]|uniref:hypothetical protein n=1 Tax=Chryseobacterium sp. TaxID=1871047 RepID=UPI00289D11DE|nr:hypothetical protein [Chryseobacterium sp.]